MRQSSRVIAFVGGLVFLVVALCVATPFLLHRDPTDAGAKETITPKKQWVWARKLVRPGLANLHQVSENLYRGAQPDPKETSHDSLVLRHRKAAV